MSPITVAYLCLIGLVGYAVVSVTAPTRRHWLELIGLSYAAGYGTVAWVLTILSMTGRAPTRVALFEIAAAAVVVLIIGRRFARPTVPTSIVKDKLVPIGGLGLIVLVPAVMNVWVAGHWPGTNDIDVFAIWMFKAKVFAAQPLRPMPAALTEPGFSYSHQDYPPTVPMATAGLYAALGRVDLEAAKDLLAPTYMALVAALYGGVRAIHRRATALGLVAVAASGPVLMHYSALQVAETPLLLMLAATVVSLMRWERSGSSADLILAALFASFAALVKNEGLALLPVWTVVVIGIWINRRSRGEDRGSRIEDGKGRPSSVLHPPSSYFVPIPIAVVIATLLPWLIYRTHLPHTHEDYGGRLTSWGTITSGLGRLGPAARRFFPLAVDHPSAGLFWLVFALAVVVGAAGFRRVPVIALWTVLVAQIGLYLASFVVTPWAVDVLVPMVGGRLLDQAVPVATLLIAQHLHAAGWPGGSPSIPQPD